MLARHAGKLVPRERLIRAIWGTDATDKVHDLQVYIARLRHKLNDHGGGNLIRGEGNVGYSLLLAADGAGGIQRPTAVAAGPRPHDEADLSR